MKESGMEFHIELCVMQCSELIIKHQCSKWWFSAVRPTWDHPSEVARVQWRTMCIAVMSSIFYKIFGHFSWSTQYCGIPTNMVSQSVIADEVIWCTFQTFEWACFRCSWLLLKGFFFFFLPKYIGKNSCAFACDLGVNSSKCLVASLVDKILDVFTQDV